MSEILCKWLNKELRLSKSVEPNTISKDFASGYLIGEVLHKYQLQDDFSLFTRNNTSNSKLNNFARIKPTLQLLGVPFDLTTAQALMQEQQGATTRFLYQLYISLEKKKKAGISAAVMEISQPAAAACLHKKENEIYADRLHMVVKRDADLKLEKISQRYEDRTQQWNDKSAMAQLVQQQKQLKVQEEMRMKNIEKLRASRQRQNEVMARIQASIVQVPKPPPNRLLQNLEKRRQQQRHREQQAQCVFSSSSQTLPGDSCTWGSSHGRKVLGGGPEVVLQSNSEYIQRIHQRLEEDAMARQQRDKRRRQFLVEQFKAHEAQEEAKREEQLVKRLTRQTQQERRLEVQLLQIRKQKEVIRENRLFREQQYQQRRERDFQEALEREAALARQAKLDQAEEIRKELEHYNRIAAERAENRYKKHFKSCREILEQIVDLATKVGEYRLFTGNLIPVKMMREWKELLFCGLPQYEPVTEGQQPGFKSSAPIDSVELEKQETLNNQDYDEYTNMVGNWAWPEEAGETKCPPTKNRILGHIILRLRNIAHPPTPDSPSPSFTHFTLKACVLGKQYSGKTTCLARIAEAHGICVLSADILIQEALMAYQNGEEVSHISHNILILVVSYLIKCNQGHFKGPFTSRLSTRAQLGAAAEKELRKCKSVPNELMVDIMVEAIRQIPAYSGWILDGFPMNITQAVLLEKALGGSGDLQGRAVSSRTNLAIEPNATKMPQPPAPVLDVALLLDISDEHVIVRAVQQTCISAPNSIQDPVTITTAGTATSSGGAVVATAFSPRNKTLEKAQIQHSIIAFQDTWSKLEKWFGRKQNILVRVDADVEEEELYKKVESVLQHVMMQRQKGNWSLCESYVSNIKTVMQDLRSERNLIIHHLFNTREEFKHYLSRPDLKQEFVSQWQRDYNSIPEDMRGDDDTRAELHQRLDDLRECLWDICDKRKEENEQERAALMGNRWLEDHTAVLINDYSALMQHAVKARLELVRGCALVTVRSLQRTTEQTFSSLKKWLEAHYLAEMKKYDEYAYVFLRSHPILSLQECTDFYVDGDLRLVASPPPPPRPSAMEKPTNSSLTIAQLEALYQQLCKVAPSGLMSSFDFTNTLQNIISVNMCSRSLPESWISMTESQLMEIISLLTHDAEMLDWHRFLLSAALPWPIPSLTQLLSVLRRFQGLDTHSSGYINEQQYLQTELWFPSETVQPVPEDPSEPLPYDRLANLRKFFFQLFADHSVSPPRLEYVSMLQYFSAHPDSAQGFVRALSVVVGQHLKHSSTTHLPFSSVCEAGTPELEGEHTEGDGEETACGSSSLLGEQGVSIPNLVRIFGELGYRPEEHIPFSVLSQHPFIQGLVDSSTYYKLIVKPYHNLFSTDALC
uniref:Sperm flagellar 2 n=1 Tax=Myripristis murdjan TaxID=586833 RepID=A0A668A6P5_9TELE